MKELTIAPLKGVRKFHSKQSAHEHMPEVPFRLIALGNSGSGKTPTLQNMLQGSLQKFIYGVRRLG